MRRSDMLALTGVVIASLMGIGFGQSRSYDLYFGQMPFGKWLIATAGWMVATYGPVLIALSLWRLAKKHSVRWPFHLLLLPALWAALVAGNALMLFTLPVPDFDDTLGAPIMPALVTITATLAIYYSALLVEQMSKLKARSTVR